MAGSWHMLLPNTNSYKSQVYNIIIAGWKVAVFSRTAHIKSIHWAYLDTIKVFTKILQMGASHNVYKL